MTPRSPVLVQRDRKAAHGTLGDEGVQFVRSLRPAAILQAILAPAELAAFRRIDPPQADARAMDFQRVAVDDAGLPREIIGERNRYRPKDKCRKRRSYLEQIADRRLIFGDRIEVAHRGGPVEWLGGGHLREAASPDRVTS